MASPPKSPTKTPTAAVWSTSEVDRVVKSLNFKAPHPGDTPFVRAAVRQFQLLVNAVAQERIEPAARPAALAFVRNNLAAFYKWLRPANGKGRWSLAELEGAPFFRSQERERWGRINDPGRRASYTMEVMSRRAAKLLSTVGGAQDLATNAMDAQKRTRRL
jgi:hypothetical protein